MRTSILNLKIYTEMRSPDPKRPLSTGLNSQLVKQNGKLVEKLEKAVGGTVQLLTKLFIG